MGFAFVEFESKDEADRAIEEFNNKAFKDRNIYVKRAVPPPTDEEKQKRAEEFRAKKAEQKASKPVEVDEKENGKFSESKQKTSKAKKKVKNELSDKSGRADNPEVLEHSRSKVQSDDVSTKIPEGKKSEDTIFITNLDYKVDVKTLSNLFKDLKPKWIHVPTRRVPYHVLNRQRKKGRSIFNKGIAFVKFSSPDIQKQAFEEFNGRELNGRNIIVDIAVDARIPKEDDAKENESTDQSDLTESDGVKEDGKN